MTDNVGIKEAADYVGCSVAALRTWKRQGRGPKYFRLGKLLRYRKADLDEWILDQIATPKPSISSEASNATDAQSPAMTSTPATSTEAWPRATNPPYSSADPRLALLRRRRSQEQ